MVEALVWQKEGERGRETVTTKNSQRQAQRLPQRCTCEQNTTIQQVRNIMEHAQNMSEETQRAHCQIRIPRRGKIEVSFGHKQECTSQMGEFPSCRPNLTQRHKAWSAQWYSYITRYKKGNRILEKPDGVRSLDALSYIKFMLMTET